MQVDSLFAVILILVSQLLCTLAVAPEDHHPVCRTHFLYSPAHEWIPYANDTSSGTWRVLVDQYDYQNLLGQSLPVGVWTAVDFDGDGLQMSHGGGGTCTWQIRTGSSFSNPDTNNWIFTQAIDYFDAVELIVNATVRLVGCTQRPDCSNDFLQLYRYDSNSTNDPQRTNRDVYQPYLVDPVNSRLQQDSSGGDTTIIRRFLRPPNLNYAYFGVQDIGSSGTLTRLLVYYEVCPRRVGHLVIYPEIPRPPRGSSTPIVRRAECVENAHNITRLETYSYDDGRCVQETTCICNLGYMRGNDNQCAACSAGQYRSALNSSCVNCPANSNSMEASNSCSCIAGYYRAEGEGIGVQCTAPPPTISECEAGTAFDTGASIQWRSPSHCGGRTDCYYQIQINDDLASPYNPSNFHFNSLVMETIDNLRPDTTYSITVSVHNGVSAQEPGSAKLRECTIVVTTIQGSVFMLKGTTYFNNTAVTIEQISEEGSSLLCTTALGTCCQNSRQGNFYDPENNLVQLQQTAISRKQSLYIMGNRASVSLHKRPGDAVLLGIYRCQIPDGRGVLQNLFITIATTRQPVDPPTTMAPPTCPVTEPCPPIPAPIPESSMFMFKGQTFPNNSVFLMREIGTNEMALRCITDHVACCQTNVDTGWFYPNSSLVSFDRQRYSIYERRISQAVTLIRRDNTLSPTGEYRCRIPDASGSIQTLVANIVVESEGACPTTPPVTEACPISTTQTPPVELIPLTFRLGNTVYPNNTVVLLEDIGVANDALHCVSNSTRCCDQSSSFRGEFRYPNGSLVQIQSVGYSMYRDRGSSFIRLNVLQVSSMESSLGRYRCEIRDDSGTVQWLYINIAQNRSCPTPPTTTTPEPIVSPGPTTSVFDCNSCPVSPTQPCTGCPVSPGVEFEFGGVRHPNNSVFLLNDIGQESNALHCITDNMDCCSSGEWIYPNNSRILMDETRSSLYTTRGSQFISLNRRDNALSPTGEYHCRIPDASGSIQTLMANIVVEEECPTTCTSSPTPQSPSTTEAEDTAVLVVGVVNDVIILDVPESVLRFIVEFRLRLTLSDNRQRISKKQTKDIVEFTVKSIEKPYITIPLETLSSLIKTSTYLLQIKPLFFNGSEGEYGPAYRFEYSGSVRDSTALSSIDGGDQVDSKFLALAIVVTFVVTAIVVSLLVLAVVWLCFTWRGRRASKRYTIKANKL